LEELYALLTFILPSIFNDAETFNSMFNFSQITNSDGSKLSESDEVTLLIAQLQNILKPFMLRRCKKDVVKDLPLKKE
jgi:ATP-dependent DNA helicase